jgi:hypothetical protein
MKAFLEPADINTDDEGTGLALVHAGETKPGHAAFSKSRGLWV